jgi:CRP-like cAMP-binding protein
MTQIIDRFGHRLPESYSMPANAPSAEHGRLIRKLESVSPLHASDRDAVAGLPLRTRSVDAGQDLIEQGSVPTECCFVVEGLVARYALTPTGTRQIVSFHIAGDLPDRDSLHMPRLDHAVGSISAARVAFIPHAAIGALIAAHPNVGVALWRDSVVDAGVFRQWLVSVGRRSARQKVAHLICEMFTRMDGLGLADGDHFSFPVTQTHLGDALGLSSVHINRTLQELRAEQLISWKGTVVTIHNGPELRTVADFDPGYLELKPAHWMH